MPVMGPNKDYADNLGNAATDAILTLLVGNFGVERPCDLDVVPMGKKFASEWDEQVNKLREVVKEMVWIDHCASF